MSVTNKFKQTAKNICAATALLVTGLAVNAQYGGTTHKTTVSGTGEAPYDDGISVYAGPGLRTAPNGTPHFDMMGGLYAPFSKGPSPLKLGVFGEVGYTTTGEKIGVGATLPTLYGSTSFSISHSFNHAWLRVGPRAELNLANSEKSKVTASVGAFAGAVNFPGQRVNNLYLSDYELGTQARVFVGTRLKNGNAIGIAVGMENVVKSYPNKSFLARFRDALYDIGGVRKPERVGTQFHANVFIPLAGGSSNRHRNRSNYNSRY